MNDRAGALAAHPGPGDLAREAVDAVLDCPLRSLLTVLGSALGVGTCIAVLGLTLTAGGQVSQRFTALVATEITVGLSPEHNAADAGFPVDADARAQRLAGVTAAGTWWPVRLPAGSGVSGRQPSALSRLDPEEQVTTVVAVSPGLLRAVHPALAAGVTFDDFHDRRSERVALLDRGLAEQLGISRLDAAPAVFVDGTPLTVIGIIDEVRRRPDLLLSVVVPRGTARVLWGPPEPGAASMIIETRLGAARQVARQISVALRPEAPDMFVVTPPPDPYQLRDTANRPPAGPLLGLAAVSLIVGAFGIANTAFVSVRERAGQIRLRRVAGARPGTVAARFLVESGLLGGLGGLAGTALGVIAVVVASMAASWTPIIPPWIVAAGPATGAVTGLIAGAYPAVRVARG